MADAMREGRVETAAVVLPFNEDTFELTPFSEESLMLLMSPSHPLAIKKEVHFNELINEPFIFLF